MFILHGSTCFHFILLHLVKHFPSVQFGSTSISEALLPDPFWAHLVSNYKPLSFSLVQAYPRYSKSPSGLPWNNTHCPGHCSFYHLLNFFLFSIFISSLRALCRKWSHQSIVKILQWCSRYYSDDQNITFDCQNIAVMLKILQWCSRYYFHKMHHFFFLFFPLMLQEIVRQFTCYWHTMICTITWLYKKRNRMTVSWARPKKLKKLERERGQHGKHCITGNSC